MVLFHAECIVPGEIVLKPPSHAPTSKPTTSYPTAYPTFPTQSSSNDNSLSSGAQAGIAIGVILGVAMLGAGVYYYMKSGSSDIKKPLVGVSNVV